MNFCTGIIEFDLLPSPSVVTNRPRVTIAAAEINEQGGPNVTKKLAGAVLRCPGLSWSSQIENPVLYDCLEKPYVTSVFLVPKCQVLIPVLLFLMYLKIKINSVLPFRMSQEKKKKKKN